MSSFFLGNKKKEEAKKIKNKLVKNDTNKIMAIPKVLNFVWVGGRKLMPQYNINNVIDWAVKNPECAVNMWVDVKSFEDAGVSRYDSLPKLKECYLKIFTTGIKEKIKNFTKEKIETAADEKTVKELEELLKNLDTEKSRLHFLDVSADDNKDQQNDECSQYELFRPRPNLGSFSDLKRIQVLKSGGIYIDSDAECGSKSFEELGVFKKGHKHRFIVDKNTIKQGKMSNDFIGTTPQNPIIDEIYQAILRNYNLPAIKEDRLDAKVTDFLIGLDSKKYEGKFNDEKMSELGLSEHDCAYNFKLNSFFTSFEKIFLFQFDSVKALTSYTISMTGPNAFRNAVLKYWDNDNDSVEAIDDSYRHVPSFEEKIPASGNAWISGDVRKIEDPKKVIANALNNLLFEVEHFKILRLDSYLDYIDLEIRDAKKKSQFRNEFIEQVTEKIEFLQKDIEYAQLTFKFDESIKFYKKNKTLLEKTHLFLKNSQIVDVSDNFEVKYPIESTHNFWLEHKDLNNFKKESIEELNGKKNTESIRKEVKNFIETVDSYKGSDIANTHFAFLQELFARKNIPFLNEKEFLLKHKNGVLTLHDQHEMVAQVLNILNRMKKFLSEYDELSKIVNGGDEVKITNFYAKYGKEIIKKQIEDINEFCDKFLKTALQSSKLKNFNKIVFFQPSKEEIENTKEIKHLVEEIGKQGNEILEYADLLYDDKRESKLKIEKNEDMWEIKDKNIEGVNKIKNIDDVDNFIDIKNEQKKSEEEIKKTKEVDNGVDNDQEGNGGEKTKKEAKEIKETTKKVNLTNDDKIINFI